jgi:hypothetical protein
MELAVMDEGWNDPGGTEIDVAQKRRLALREAPCLDAGRLIDPR